MRRDSAPTAPALVRSVLDPTVLALKSMVWDLVVQAPITALTGPRRAGAHSPPRQRCRSRIRIIFIPHQPHRPHLSTPRATAACTHARPFAPKSRVAAASSSQPTFVLTTNVRATRLQWHIQVRHSTSKASHFENKMWSEKHNRKRTADHHHSELVSQVQNKVTSVENNRRARRFPSSTSGFKVSTTHCATTTRFHCAQTVTH